MKSTAIFLAIVAFTSADLIPRDNSTSVASSPPSTTTWALTPAQICLQGCASGDVNCQAACVGSAHPNSVQVSETNDCIGKCPKGNGTYAESANYASCMQACISSYYPTSQTVGAVGGGSGTTVASNKATATGTGTAGGVATGEYECHANRPRTNIWRFRHGCKVLGFFCHWICCYYIDFEGCRSEYHAVTRLGGRFCGSFHGAFCAVNEVDAGSRMAVFCSMHRNNCNGKE